MKLMIFITPPHLHSSGSTSYTRLINLAQVETEPARGPGSGDVFFSFCGDDIGPTP